MGDSGLAYNRFCDEWNGGNYGLRNIIAGLVRLNLNAPNHHRARQPPQTFGETQCRSQANVMSSSEFLLDQSLIRPRPALPVSLPSGSSAGIANSQPLDTIKSIQNLQWRFDLINSDLFTAARPHRIGNQPANPIVAMRATNCNYAL